MGQVENFNKYNELDPSLTKKKIDFGLMSRYADYLNDLSEHEQELKDLLDRKEQFSISAEVQYNRERFRQYEEDQQKPGRDSVISG